MQKELSVSDLTKDDVAGHIAKPCYFDFWKTKLNAPEDVLESLIHGYKIPLFRQPPECELPHNASARDPENAAFLDKDIRNLLAIKAIYKVKKKPWLVLPLQVSHPFGRRKRIIVDASRSLNIYVIERQVKLDHLEKVLADIPDDVFFAVCDISRGYYHVLVAEEHQSLLGFHWRFQDGEESYFQWRVAFLGISDLVFWFTKLMAPIKKYLRGHGVPAYCYIDDVLITGRTEAECRRNRAFFRDTLRRAGFIESLEKAIEPTTKGVFLGLTLDTKNRLVFIPDEKIKRIEDALSAIASKRTEIVRNVSKAVGLVMSALLAVGPSLILLCRSIYAWEQEAQSYDDVREVEPIRGDLIYLKSIIRKIHGYPFQVHEMQHPISVVLASDASGTGRAIVSITCSASGKHEDHAGPCGSPIYVCEFTAEEMKLSSAWRELKALHDCYYANGAKFRGQSILHLTDSSSVEAIMRKGSKRPYLQKLALDIYRACREHEIDLKVEWRSRADPRLQLADQFSRPQVDIDDWGIDQESLQMVMDKLGEPVVDLFASDANHRFPLFYSDLASVNAIGVNAFAANWDLFTLGYACPPPKLVKAVVKQIVRQKADVILVIPRWRSLSAWPLLASDGAHLNKIVIGWMQFWPVLHKGEQVKSDTFSGRTPFPFLGLRLSGKVENPFVPRANVHFCVLSGCKICKK